MPQKFEDTYGKKDTYGNKPEMHAVMPQARSASGDNRRAWEYLKASHDKSAPLSLPPSLSEHLDELEKWATQNKLDARKDLAAFWALKIPAILSSAFAGVLGHFSLTTVSMIAGAIASVCVIIDGVHPKGMLRNTHLRAYHDIRILASSMMNKWRSRNRSSKDDNVVSGIIRDGEAERARIAAYVRDAETALRFEDTWTGPRA
jgi:hypothetical protein